MCAAGDIQAPEAQEAGKGGDPEKRVSPADRQALLQFLRMMRKGKVRHSRSGHLHPLVLMLSRCCWLLARAEPDRPVSWLGSPLHVECEMRHGLHTPCHQSDMHGLECDMVMSLLPVLGTGVCEGRS